MKRCQAARCLCSLRRVLQRASDERRKQSLIMNVQQVGPVSAGAPALTWSAAPRTPGQALETRLLHRTLPLPTNKGGDPQMYTLIFFFSMLKCWPTTHTRLGRSWSSQPHVTLLHHPAEKCPRLSLKSDRISNVLNCISITSLTYPRLLTGYRGEGDLTFPNQLVETNDA